MLLIMLIGLSLAGTSGASLAAPSAGCSMPGAEMGIAADHEKMPCCAPDCTAPAAAAVLPKQANVRDALAPKAVPTTFPRGSVLPSLNPAALDPPPRVHTA